MSCGGVMSRLEISKTWNGTVDGLRGTRVVRNERRRRLWVVPAVMSNADGPPILVNSCTGKVWMVNIYDIELVDAYE